MKKITTKIVKSSAKRSLNNSLNTTTCVNIYQPKVPKKYKDSKKQ